MYRYFLYIKGEDDEFLADAEENLFIVKRNWFGKNPPDFSIFAS